MKKTSPKLRLPGKFDPPTGWLIWYFLVTLMVLWGWQELFQQFAVRTISYSQFKAHVARREDVEAAVKQEEILGRIDGARFYQLIGREMPRPKEPVPVLEVAVATAPNITERRP